MPREGVLNPDGSPSVATHVSLLSRASKWYDVGARLRQAEREATERGGSSGLCHGRGC
jgi:hypothetical protein